MAEEKEKNGLLIVSGCPRSGTSVCMDIQRVAHGEENILGEKFPQETRKQMREKMLERQEGEPEHDHIVRKYLIEKQIEQEKNSMSEEEREFKDMNPEGFWEMAFTVRGVVYQAQFKELLSKILAGKEHKVCKVVSQGLLNSDPMYLGKIIYMIRHPRAVAKSQERLRRQLPDPIVNGKKVKFHTPEMYISVTGQAARFFLMYPEVPVRFFHYEELLERPKEIIDEMQEFVGYGDYSKAYGIVQPKLNRSKHENVPNNLWEDAMFVYEEFCKAAKIINSGGKREEANKHFEAILKYLSNPKNEFNRSKRHWRCYRAKMNVNEVMCKACMSNPGVRENLKLHSEKTEGKFTKHWSKEPCLFECGLDLDREKYLTIEESIKNNFWYRP